MNSENGILCETKATLQISCLFTWYRRRTCSSISAEKGNFKQDRSNALGHNKGTDITYFQIIVLSKRLPTRAKRRLWSFTIEPFEIVHDRPSPPIWTFKDNLPTSIEVQSSKVAWQALQEAKIESISLEHALNMESTVCNRWISESLPKNTW